MLLSSEQPSKNILRNHDSPAESDPVQRIHSKIKTQAQPDGAATRCRRRSADKFLVSIHAPTWGATASL